MSLTRAQLISGDVSKGTVLAGQVQGVKKGTGVSIDSSGTISFDASSAAGVVKTNNVDAYNSYVWPSSAPGPNSQLLHVSGNNLSWVTKETFGFGLPQSDSKVKQGVPIISSGGGDPAPEIGTGADQATSGSLYWDSSLNQLYIAVGGSWQFAALNPNSIVGEYLLSGSYTLYVNPEIGSDIYVTGFYNETDGITNQMVTAGYTPQRPFKTIQRAALEVARIQNGVDPDSLLYDRFLIKCSTGEHIIYNDKGVSLGTITAWTSGEEPSSEDMRKLNSEGYAGVILPRGVSIIGEDLRKTVIRPSFVPDRDEDIELGRASIFRITGGAFFFNFTFKDKQGWNKSHHLLDCFSFVNEGDLADYYEKTKTTFSEGSPNAVTNPGETEIVAPQPEGIPTSSTDGIIGSSPYIFNCSVRSSYGLCGINADGNDVTGFRSMVVAQFTGVSLQKDMTCWQVYTAGSWESLTSQTQYSTYISSSPDNVRMRPERRSFHVRAINNAFIQEVSVFAIGQGLHHWVKDGGEISITNSNSSFGGCAALAEGYRTIAFPQDKNWNVSKIVVGTNLNNQSLTITPISIGTIDSYNELSFTITLTQPLVQSTLYPGQPEILASRGYTFAEDSYLWVENPAGEDWRAKLDASAWGNSNPENIVMKQLLRQPDTDGPESGQPAVAANLVGKKVYIRRLLDTRTLNQRRYSLHLNNTASIVRTPPRDYILQTTTPSSEINSLLSDQYMVGVYKTGSISPVGEGVTSAAEVVLGRTNPDSDWVPGQFYRPGDTVRYNQKHYTCAIENSDVAFSTDTPSKWIESYVHMPTTYNAYDYMNNIAPIIIFDNDTDQGINTTNCGYDFDPTSLTYSWKVDDKLTAQYRTAVDFLGIYQFLRGLGFSNTNALAILLPQDIDTREIDPVTITYPLSPTGAAASVANWPVEFRRPSTLRLFSHAWEWAGYLNYTKALPAYQGELSLQNQFTYYFTNQMGGRVYASGYNQEGYLVTPAGLTDLATGNTVDIANIGNPISGVDVPTSFENLTVKNLTVEGQLTLSPQNYAKAGPVGTTPEKPGIVYALANIDDLTNVNLAPAANNEQINSLVNNGVVTVKGLNAWKVANKLISAATGELNVYVKMDGRSASLEEMLSVPPTTPNDAVKTIAMAAAYVNEVLLGSERTAVVNVAAGLYNPVSTWECNVTFKAWNSDFSAQLCPGTSINPGTYNHFKGAYYGEYTGSNATVNFWAYSLTMVEPTSSVSVAGKQEFRMICSPRTMEFNRSVDFIGGFHFLGLSKIIEIISTTLEDEGGPAIPVNAFLTYPSLTGPLAEAFTLGEDNLSTLLNKVKEIRDEDIASVAYNSLTGSPLMRILSRATDTVRIRNCVFGPGLPTRKEAIGGPRNPLLATNGDASVNLHNIYIRGKSKISSSIMGFANNANNNIPLSGLSHYGKTNVTGITDPDWDWYQSYHTFLGVIPESFAPISLDLGSNFRYKTGTAPFSYSYYENRVSPPNLPDTLPNHIHLLDNDGNEGGPETGPFFDQFFHAPAGFTGGGWIGAGEVSSQVEVAKTLQGFVGVFGENGYNSTKTRGVLGGDGGVLDPETGFYFTLSGVDIGNSGRSLFQKAGVPNDVVTAWGRASYMAYKVDLNGDDDKLEMVNHPFKDGDTIRLSYLTGQATLPAGLSTDRTYYVISSVTDSFQVSKTSGGSAETFASPTGDIQYYYANFYYSYDATLTTSGPGPDYILEITVPYSNKNLSPGDRIFITRTDATSYPAGVLSSTSYCIIEEGYVFDPLSGDITFRVSDPATTPNSNPLYGDAITTTTASPIGTFIVSIQGMDPGLSGSGFPSGNNPVIEFDGSGFAQLNVGLRNYGLGISPKYGTRITATNTTL